MSSFTIYKGVFPCHTCKVDVLSLRCYAETQEVTWMCKDKHLSRVSFAKRKRSDFDGEE
jgi:deoxycytidylate deaminase